MADRKLVMYGAPWCAPCKGLKPLAIKECEAAGIGFEYVNIEEQPERAMMAGVQGVPTVMVYDGSTLAQEFGPSQATPAKLKNLIRQAPLPGV